MDRAWKSGASATPPVAPSSPSIGYPTSGDAGGGVPKTVPGPYWHHMITEELRNIVLAGGLTPSQGSLTQVLAALQAMFVGLGAFTGANQQKSNNGWQKLPGGLILQWGSVSANAATEVGVTFPIAFPNAVFGVFASPNPAGAGITTIVAGPKISTSTSGGFTYANTNTSGAVFSFYLAIGH